MVHITFSNQLQNTNTFDHAYYVKNKGWCSYIPNLTKERYGIVANKLSIGDTVMLYNNGKLIEITIMQLEERLGELPSYNIKTKNNHNYFANGIVVYDETIFSKD